MNPSVIGKSDLRETDPAVALGRNGHMIKRKCLVGRPGTIPDEQEGNK